MASRAFIKSLKKDQILRAVVEEATSSTSALCNFQGELLLIANHTGQNLQAGDPISLQVTRLDPLQFHIFDGNAKRFQRVV